MAKKLKRKSVSNEEMIQQYVKNDPLLSLMEPLYEDKEKWISIVKSNMQSEQRLKEKEINRKRRYK